MALGDLVRISPDLTHLPDWVLGKVIDIQDNPYVGSVVAAETKAGVIYFGYEYLFEEA